MELFLEIKTGIEQIREPDEDAWDRGESNTDWDFGKVFMNPDKRYGEYEFFSTSETFKPGDEIFVVIAVYNTGDSFGWDHNGSMEIMYATKDEKVAYEVEARLEKITEKEYQHHVDLRMKGKNYGTELVYPDGSLISIPWFGYFESLSYLTVHRTKVR